jgi:hypothetical protein
MNKNYLYLTDMPADVALNAGEHNYIKLLKKYFPGFINLTGVYFTDIAHDDECAIYKMGNCNCYPNITIRNAVTREKVFCLRWK